MSDLQLQPPVQAEQFPLQELPQEQEPFVFFKVRIQRNTHRAIMPRIIQSSILMAEKQIRRRR